MRQNIAAEIDYDGLSRTAIQEVTGYLEAIKRLDDEISRMRIRIREVIDHDREMSRRCPYSQVARLFRLRHKQLGNVSRAYQVVAAESGWPLSLVVRIVQTDQQHQRRKVARRRREDIVQHYRRGLTYKEIAARAKCSQAWVSRVLAEEIGPRDRRRRKTSLIERP